MEYIFKRRSIRKFKNIEIEDEKIEEILRAAMAAPSARGLNPWHFFVIRNRDILNKIPEVHPYASMCKEAPMAIVVCFDVEEGEKSKDWMQQDLSACTQNILLAVSELGLGAVWLGCYPREDRVNGLKRLLGIEDDFIPFSLIPIGYPDEQKEPKGEFDNSKVAFID